ncbi:MAG: hypothetical protein JNL18_19025 [Planctomycetaceae bacterium]|nr:hypothetical protein [Planctomycetaceae bacterium]
MSTASEPIRFTIQSALAWTAFVALGCWTAVSCRAFYEVFGEFLSGFMVVIAVALLVATPVILASPYRRAWLLAAAGAMMFFSLSIAALSVRLNRLHAEAARVVKYVDAFHDKYDIYPDDLSGYAFTDAALEPYFSYDGHWKGKEFALYYHPVQHSAVRHAYTPENGYWLKEQE